LFGFTIIYNQKTPLKLKGGLTFEYISESKRSYQFNYIKFEKFNNDKLFVENDDFIIGLDGVILNLVDLKKSYAHTDYADLIIQLWKISGNKFPNYLKGEFSGFIFKKQTEELYIFNNHKASKKIFYSNFSETRVVSSSLENICLYSKSVGHKLELNTPATYELLTSGGMFENQTLINDIFRLGAGEYMNINNGELIVDKYYNFNSIEYTISSKKKAFTVLSESFEEVLKLQYQKDIEYNYNHIATLSGGLDSRLNVMISDSLNYKNDVFCFSQSNYADDKISKKIARDLNLEHTFIPLDGGNYLKNLRENNSICEGLIFYLSSAHFNYALKNLDLNNYGLIHTGQIGDGVLGGLISNLSSNKKDFNSKIISNKLINKLDRAVGFENNYKSDEIYQLYNRVFNVTHSGSFVAEKYQTYLVSPFMDVNFMEACFSIEPKLRYKQKLYVEWLNEKYPEIVKYTWESIGFKPDRISKIYLSKYTNKIKKEFYTLINRTDKLSMNPLDFWFNEGLDIQEFFDKSFYKQIHLLENNLDLLNDVKKLYKLGNTIEKSMVLTLLDFINYFEIKV
jgi:asparagine synthase (glutamine-hydrolysing)